METKAMKHWGAMLLILLVMPVLTACPCGEDEPDEPTPEQPTPTPTPDSTVTTGKADIQYRLSMTPDLLSFVTPQVTFFNGAGIKNTYIPADGDWETNVYEWDDFTMILKDFERMENYTSFGDQCGMIVKYIPKEDAVVENKEYDFYLSASCPHAIFSSPKNGLYIYSPTKVDININIRIGDPEKEENENKEEIQAFIDKLVAHSDTVLVATSPKK